tara:strand:- start:56 stop:634 length:579 start_codon:yes stop_codon:yes gene_type:complete
MGLKQDIIDAKIKAAKESGISKPLDTSNGSFIEREAHYMSEAIVKTMTEADFTITQLKAPVVVEKLKTPDQPVNIQLETLLGEYQPILKTLKQIGDPLGLGALIDSLEGEIEKAVLPLLQGGANLPGFDLSKDNTDEDPKKIKEGDGGLDAVGYVYIGEDPDSRDAFDTEDEDGQREFTTVKLIPEDGDKLL